MEANGENDDIDEDIHRLQIVLQDEEGKEEESDAEGELQSLHQDAGKITFLTKCNRNWCIILYININF